MTLLKTPDDIARCVRKTVERTPVIDIHTHLYPPSFGALMLWGIDELLTYHYLVAELFRHTPMDYERFWAMSRPAQADLIWQKLYLDSSPVSEACRGPLTTLKALGISVKSRTLREARRYFASVTAAEFVDIVFRQANVRQVVMTNDPFNPDERRMWQKRGNRDTRFASALRLDPLLMSWPGAARQLKTLGYKVRTSPDRATLREIRRFLSDWVEITKPLYLAVSLPPEFVYPDRSVRSTLIRECVLPAARKAGVPFAMMTGVRKAVNPALRLAGDSVGRADVASVETLCREFPDNRFLVSMLSRENQYELCVAARKFRNLMPFGVWWFLNNPSLVTEITSMRTELLGLGYIPQHSDARILDQLIYKWAHARAVIATVLTGKYADLARTGWTLTSDDVERDVRSLFGWNFKRFLAETPREA